MKMAMTVHKTKFTKCQIIDFANNYQNMPVNQQIGIDTTNMIRVLVTILIQALVRKYWNNATTRVFFS